MYFVHKGLGLHFLRASVLHGSRVCLLISLSRPISSDRADITFIVHELRQQRANPTLQSLAKLKRSVGYLERERQR